jgi:hypothetical protein
MAGTGNLLLKKKVGSAAANDGGIPNAGTLPESMPAVQIVGLPPVNESFNSSLSLYPGHPIANVTNRLWIGMNTSAWTATGGSSGSGWSPNSAPSATVMYGTDVTNQAANRPIWMGAEIRAWTPLVKGGAEPTTSDSLTYTILKASWDPATNDYLASYDPVAAVRVPSLAAIYASDEVLVTQRAIWYYVEGRLAQSIVGFNSTYATKTEAALLGSEGALKGTQTFLSPINVEQKLTVNGYTENSVNYPATIYSDNAEASIFNENVSSLTIGGSTSTIAIGNQSTSTSSTTIYGDLTVTADLNMSSNTIIDGGTY